MRAAQARSQTHTDSDSDSDSDWADDVGGHNPHFLRRLSRVSASEADLALRLYRDPELVGAVLLDVLGERPASDARVAVALAEGIAPPYAILAHDGGFITCLAAGMTSKGLPIVSWEWLQRVMRRVDQSRRNLRRYNEIKDVVDLKDLTRRLLRAGGRLDRESFDASEAIAPVYHCGYLVIAARSWARFSDMSVRVARMSRRSSGEQAALRIWSNMLWQTAHYWMLFATQAPQSLTEATEYYAGTARHMVDVGLWMVQWAPSPLGLRALWTIGRGGKLALPEVRARLYAARSVAEWTAAALGLYAIGLRQRRLAAEIERCFSVEKLPEALRTHASAPQLAANFRSMATELFRGGSFLPPGPTGRPAAPLLDTGDDLTDEASPTAPAGPDSGEISVDEVLERIDATKRLAIEHLPPAERHAAAVAALPTLLANTRWRLCGLTADELNLTLPALATLIRAPARAFYWPEALTVQLGVSFDPERILERSPGWTPSAPARAEKKPGRNDECSCGSGVKYKKCCGAATA